MISISCSSRRRSKRLSERRADNKNFRVEIYKIKANMQSNTVEEVTDKLEGCLSLDTGKMDKYDRYVQEGKKAARCGELSRALELFQLAYQLQPSDKLKKRIRAIQDLIQRDEEEEEDEEEEFVDVNNSGLKLYKELYDKLYDHQKEGVTFLYSLHRDGRKGGILADDMGLGKTIQVISFLSGMYDAELAKHTLLVMPTSLIKNWVREFAKWTPGMRVKEFHDKSKAKRNRNLERIQRKRGVVITTYQMLINNYEQLASYDQRKFKWDYVILDEAHKIKTSSTKTAKSAHAIPARHRVLLTGTPVQNNLREMWALFDFACQGSLLGTLKTFKTEYENPITRAREKDATPEEKALGLRISQNLMDRIKPYFLRRTKGDVQQKKQKREEGYQGEEDQENKCPNANEGAEMPSLTRKNDLIVWTYLSSIQEDIYNQFISLDHIKELLMTTRSPLAEITILKKLCDHPRLLSNRAVTQLGLAQGSAFDSTHPDNESESSVSNIDYISDDTLIAESGKLQFLVSLMECLREEGHRTLIFSQSRKMLDIIERVLRNRNFRLLRLDGTVTQLAERKKRIKLFQTDKRYIIFLLTTQVGGVGITLTAANRVVIFDPSWNPATDAQAVDRAYRIGQTENVVVYRLITCGTVEEKIYRRQVLKDSLIRQTTGDKKNPFRYFSKQDLHELFKLEDTRSSSTQQQLQAMHSKNRCSDTKLDQHIARLHSMEMFGISDHDLMFTKEVSADEDIPEDAESHHFIQTRVQKAQELMQAESEVHSQLMDSVAQNTEPAWLGQTGQPKSAVKDQQSPPRVKKEPTTLRYNFSEPELEEDEQNSPPVEEVMEVVGEEVENLVEEVQAENESSRSSGQTNVHVLNTEVSPVAEKQAHHVIPLDNNSDETNNLCGNAASEHQYLQHSFPNPSHQFPKLEELSVSDALDNREVQMDGPHSTVLSPPPSRDEDTAGEPFKAEVEILQGNFILQLEDSGDLFLVEKEVVHEVEESEESPEFHPEMDISLESLKELITLDLTHYSFSEPELEEDEQIFPLVEEVVKVVGEEVEVVGKEVQAENELSCSSGQTNVHVLNTEVSPVNEKQAHHVITLDDSSDEADKLCGNAASEHQYLQHSFPDPSHQFPNLEELSAVSDALDNREVQMDGPHSTVLSPPPSRDEDTAGEPFNAEMEILLRNFFLPLEDSADMFSVEEVHEVESSEKSPEFQLQMAIILQRLENAIFHDSRQEGKQNNNEIRNYNNSDVCNHNNAEVSNRNGEVSKHEPLLRIHSAPDTPADDSFVHSVRRKKTQVISDTEEEEEDESEKPCLIRSQLLDDDLSRLCSSMSKSTLTDGAQLHRNLNTSGPSSFLVSMLENESDEESEEPSEDKSKSYELSDANESHADESEVEEEPSSEDKIESYQMSQASETHTDESLVEEEEPNGETLNTEESESNKKLEEVEENMESRGDQESFSVVLEYIAEQESSETMDQCAPKSFPLETHILPVSSKSSDVTAAKASENTYELLVLSGKQSLAEGRKQEALDFFLKAIDINTGDTEIQLLIIQLYRQLSQ